MSEYQYYEFQAIDRPLTQLEMGELRSFSSRATITATRFVNSYSYGNFKGSPSQWMERYFDAFLYLANWGTHELMLRFPLRVLDLATAKRYCRGRSASGRVKGDHVILELRSEDEGGEWVEEDNGQLSLLISLRADVAGGDLRALYLAWLLCVQTGEVGEADEEPPCPPGLGKLTAPLEAFVDFLRVDRNLIEVAAARSPDATSTAATAEIESWVTELPESERTGLLVRLMEGTEAHLRAELLRRFGDSRGGASCASADRARTAGELLKATEQRAEERRRKEAEQDERERARREREAAAARDRHLDSLAKREVQAWDKIHALVATKQPGKYDEVVDGGEVGDVIRKEGLPGLRRRSSLARHEPSDRALGDVEAQFAEFAVDPGRSPEGVGERHLTDEVPKLGVDRGTPKPPAPRLTGPEEAESLAMPADDGLWANETQGVAPGWPAAGEPGPEDAVRWRKTRTLGTMAQNGQLLAEGKVLERQMSARPQSGDERAQQDEQEGTNGRSVTLR